MTTFHVPRNHVSTFVAAARAAGGASLVVADGSGFGAAFPLIVTAIRGDAVLAILEVTGRSTNTLTVSGAIEGTTDVALRVGDRIEMRPTALALTEVQDAVHALETGGAVDADVVHLAGDETIAGAKTFSSPITGQIGKPFSATDGNDVRMIDAPCTTAGKASMGISVAGTDFGGIGDPLYAFGYNLRASGGPIDPSEVAWGLKFEGDYWEEATGKRLCEYYIEYWPIGSLTSIRPIFIRMDRSKTDPTQALDTALYYGRPFMVADPDGTLLAQFLKGETALLAGLSDAVNTLKIAAAVNQGSAINLQYNGVDNAGKVFTDSTSFTFESINNFNFTAGAGGNFAANFSGGGALIANGGDLRAVKGTASGYFRHAGGGDSLFQIGPGSATTTITYMGCGAINSALGSTILSYADGTIVFAGLNGVTRAKIDPSGNFLWLDSVGNPLSQVNPDGSFKPAHLADSSAPSDSLYYSTTQSRLVYKDPGGTPNPL